jgi:urease accessory protein
MRRATSVLKSPERGKRTLTDIVILDYAQRSAQNMVVIGVKGGCFVLDDGSLVEVVAAPEPLIEARAGDVAGLARLAWHFGDRHVPIEMLPNRIRVRREPAIEALFTSLGAKLAFIEAPFEPEGGAYTSAHAHDHDHGHGHGHHHQDH